MDKIFNIIKRPIISEKSAVQGDAFRTYAFEVSLDANKTEVKNAVESLFSVKVQKVRTLIVHGENKRNAKTAFKLKNWKKALVTLKDGQKIELFQNV